MTAPSSLVILGASDKPDRASFLLLRRLRAAGLEPVPVNPALASIDGVPVRKSLAEVPREPDLLTVYLSAARSDALADEILALRPRRVIFNPGAENPALEARLAAAGAVTENACSLVLHAQGLLIT
jgi:predicted CoA-binding protein